MFSKTSTTVEGDSATIINQKIRVMGKDEFSEDIRRMIAPTFWETIIDGVKAFAQKPTLRTMGRALRQAPKFGKIGILWGLGIAFLLGVGMVIAIPLLILRGWAIKYVWGLFVAPLFGLPALSLVQAVGLTMTVGAFVHFALPDMSKFAEKPKGERKWWVSPVLHFVGPPTIVAGAWLVSTYGPGIEAWLNSW